MKSQDKKIFEFSMSTNQLTIEKRQQEEKTMKSGNKDIKIDIQRRQPQQNNFHPQSLPRQKESNEHEQHRSHHPSVEIERPKPPTGKLFDQSIKARNNPAQEEKNILLRSENNSQRNIDIQKSKYSVEELLRSAPSEKSITLRSRGYTMLKNYLKEMRECGMISSFNSRNYQMIKNLQNNNATLLAADKDSFVPTILQKNVNEWDENSDLACEMDIKTIFNRLTPQNIDQSIKELLSKINNEKKLEFMISTFIHKASSEKSFSHVYAEFIKKLSIEDDKLAEDIVNAAVEEFNDLVLNASNDSSDNESELYIGYAVFIGNLIKNGSIQNGTPYLTVLLDHLPIEESKPLNTHIIDMIFHFVKSVGENFIQQRSQQFSKIEEVMKNRKNIKSLHRFILIDTLEIINSAMDINGHNNNNSDSNGKDNKIQDKKNLDELKSIVRNGYASYQEDYTVVPTDVSNMNPLDFLEGSMLLFLDIKDVYDFTYYQCFVLNYLGFNPGEIISLLIKYVKIYTEQKIVSDCPLIWEKFGQILCQMIIHSILTTDDARKVHSEIIKLNTTDQKDNYDPINDVKFFINDNFDFSEAIEFNSPDYPSKDINFALRLPKLINDRDLQIPNFPRIISVGIIRSIFYKLVNESEDQSVKGLLNWKNLLYQTYLKQTKLFQEETKEEIETNGLEFTCDDVIQLISE